MVARRKTVIEAENLDRDTIGVLPVTEFGTIEERQAGWAIVREAMDGGWRSVGPYGPRADRYDRP